MLQNPHKFNAVRRDKKLVLVADTSLPRHHGVRELDRIITERGRPNIWSVGCGPKGALDQRAKNPKLPEKVHIRFKTQGFMWRGFAALCLEKQQT